MQSPSQYLLIPLCLSPTHTHTQIQRTLGRLIPCLALGHTVIDRKGIGQRKWMKHSEGWHVLPFPLCDGIVKLTAVWVMLSFVVRGHLVNCHLGWHIPKYNEHYPWQVCAVTFTELRKTFYYLHYTVTVTIFQLPMQLASCITNNSQNNSEHLGLH